MIHDGSGQDDHGYDGCDQDDDGGSGQDDDAFVMVLVRMVVVMMVLAELL